MIGQLLTGRYLILEKLGAGGFSETYLARDKYLPYHPLCVVKCLKLPSNSAISLETAQRLFETEACLLERLGRHHPQIPTLFAYCHEQESVYLVQEYIDGENLSKCLASGSRLSSEAAIKLLLELLPVLEYVHSHRVIHRDITPSNLIRRRDGSIVLIDFGAACFLPEDEANTKPDDTAAAVAIGTPGYMSYEQQLGMAHLNSDLFALGILVIHLLTGTDPRQFKPDPISGELDWQCHLQNSSIEPELVTILNGMVRGKVDDRYQQAADVLTELQALPAAKRLQRWGSRWPWLSNWGRVVQRNAIPITAVLMLAGVGGWFAQANSAAIGTVLSQVGQSLPQSNLRLMMLHDMPVKSPVDRMMIAPNNRVLVTAGADHRLHLWSVPKGTLLKTLPGHQAAIKTLAISSDSRLLVSGSDDGNLRLWDLTTGKLLRVFQGHSKAITAIAISPNARTLASGSQDGTLRQWNLQTGALLTSLKLSDREVTALTYTASSDRLVSASNNGASARQLQVWNLRTGQLTRTFTGHTDAIVSLQVVDDQMLYSFGKDRGMVWNLQQEELVQVLPESSASSLGASRCHRHVMTIHDDGTIRVWVPKAGRLVMRKAGTLERNTNATLSPDHHYLASWSANQGLRVWQLQDKTVY